MASGNSKADSVASQEDYWFSVYRMKRCTVTVSKRVMIITMMIIE